MNKSSIGWALAKGALIDSRIEELGSISSVDARMAFSTEFQLQKIYQKRLNSFLGSGWSQSELFTSMGPSFGRFRKAIFDDWYSKKYSTKLTAKSYRVMSKAWGFIALFGKLSPFCYQYVPLVRHVELAMALTSLSSPVELTACALIFDCITDNLSRLRIASKTKVSNKEVQSDNGNKKTTDTIPEETTNC
jgi:hypothetical protein